VKPQPKKDQILEKIERRILYGLSCEWESALWVLSPNHRKLMSKPFLCLRDMRKKFGHWSCEKHEICLNRNFVLNHPWDSVRDVLLHEMAHQFADQVLKAHNDPPHGPAFLQACRLLRANPKASGNYKTLWEQISHDSLSREDTILLRIKKLMALAQSQNRHEAEAAMTKAHELIARYNVDLLEYNKKRNFFSVFAGKPALRHPREVYHLARLLIDFYFIEGIWVPAYVLDKGKMGRVLEITGTVQNIKIASYIHDFVGHYINSQWNTYNHKNRLNRYRKTDFAVGIIEGFRSKLDSQNNKKKKFESESALIKLEDPLLKQYIAYKYPRTTSFSRQVSSEDENIVKDGMKIGRKLVISKGITEQKHSRRLLPG
jgi:hypothetical protein